MTSVALIIPAAGNGRRFGGERPKQYLSLRGRPVLAWTLDAFAGLVHGGWIAVDDAWHDEAARIAAAAPFPCHVVRGGDTRQASVAAALQTIPADFTEVLIHDAVRPLVPRSCIRACIAALAEAPAAVVAVPCAATVKRSADGQHVSSTVPRQALWLAQTPQGLRRNEALRAFAHAASTNFNATDDAQIAEHAGLAVRLVPGDARNLKITTPDDWVVAEALLAKP